MIDIFKMDMDKKRKELLDIINEVAERDSEVLFVYLYGSSVYDTTLFNGDI